MLTNSLAATTTATAFDPFNGKTSPAVLAALGGGGVAYTSGQGLKDAELDFDGPLFTLPGGAVRLAVGGESRYESVDGVPYKLVDYAPTNVFNGP